MRKKTILSVAGVEKVFGTNSTFGGLIDLVNDNSDARIVDSNGNNYDFVKEKVKMYDIKDGKLRDIGYQSPNADLWIVYSDGDSTDTAKLGYKRHFDYHNDWTSFLSNQIKKGNVAEIVNSPETEKKTLKDYFVNLDPEENNIIPTYAYQNFEDFYESFKDTGVLVAKNIWGSAMKGVFLVDTLEKAEAFKSEDLSEFVFQDFSPGDEKRFLISGGKVVDGFIIYNRQNPWNKDSDSRMDFYNEDKVRAMNDPKKLEQFFEEVNYANKLAKKSGLLIGSIDFLGSRINEINGGGTSFKFNMDKKQKPVDNRKYLYDYLGNKIIS